MTDVLEQARAWLADDPDPATRAELQAVLDAAVAGDTDAAADLSDRFAGILQFGTAGLRGAIGAGPSRMNRAVVIRAAAGLAAFLLAARTPVNGARHRVIVGYDARYRSYDFATDTAAVLTAAGIEALVMPRLLPTPVLAFSVRHLSADAGVMVTASHNPPQDNGYKVYLGGPDGGSQLVAPADAEIAAHIDAVDSVASVPRTESGWAEIGEEVVTAYLAAAAGVAEPGGPRDLRIVHTSLHGVGGVTAGEALIRAGFTDLHTVAEQAEPDPDFPTVAFPNPEEPGAIDLALALARRVGADVVIANDPDADRCAVALPDAGGEWRMLHGDEVGGLLGEHLARRGRTGVLANSIVSSRLLGRIAAALGLSHEETLTGFKWISRVPGLTFGYEEALGYCVDPESVRDKDGISTAVLVAELAAQAKAAGRTLWDLLDDLAVAHGLHATDQLSVRVDDLSLIAGAMARLRSASPPSLGGSEVVTADDLLAGDGGLPPTDGLRYLTADATRAVVRPSGTEPKLKCYLEVVVPVGDGDVGTARAVARERLAAVRADVAAALGLEAEPV
ncbi:phospho-sugar mutase [Jiangella alkaliphila]|uniref:Phosphomannomutase n=1 Tax=Jiangella alkaliphila TaxID=419479 RepID=A0A1H2M3E0_9ACTN|nr:phospho-sugar mutase [Jiangella alkaliphila]SDU87654.1 phosphomannomutase [Jiangella alkaliphila]